MKIINPKSLKYVLAMMIFLGLISSSLVYGMVKPVSYAGNTFHTGDQFFLTGSTIEYLGTVQEGDDLRIELYHYAWTSEINGLNFTFRTVDHPDPIEVLPETRYKGFYSIKVNLLSTKNWKLARIDVSNVDKSLDKKVTDSNTKKIYLNEEEILKTAPAFLAKEEYAIRFYETRIEQTQTLNQDHQQSLVDLDQAIIDLIEANQMIDDNLSMLTDTEKKHAENSRNGNLSKITSLESNVEATKKLIEENNLRIKLMEAEIEFLRTGIRPIIEPMLENDEDKNDELPPTETPTEPPANPESDEAKMEPSESKTTNQNIQNSNSETTPTSEENQTDITPQTEPEATYTPPENTPPPTVNPTPIQPVIPTPAPPANPPQTEPEGPLEFEFLP